MCGRYVLEGPLSRLTEHFNARYTGDESQVRSSYNIAPTAQVPVVRINREGERVMLLHTWGLIPHWATDKTISAKLNNARGETVHEKPSFRTAFKKFRCLIPASGYYEWQAPPQGSKARKQPFYIYPSDLSPYFAMAGVCDHWVDKSTGELVMSTAIITTEPCEALKEVHERMPVMVPKEQWADWLDPKNQDIKALRNYIVSSENVKFHTVGFEVSGVGKNRTDSPELAKPNRAK
ncbi:SOS response-associated peptidase [Limnobacter parvus]|uniref:Abasic site processing protein n=1 Tax=Limnobacter parvus TaxID=2939690 RepID=A0ABT1XE69_9BURK|nr:SOS response-associated peptidase [Limnobacter parvus]MCR2745568.1 SOS response-associated peptidase [Limnobacter parvus]